MNRLKCIIVDDEPVARKILREFVENTPFMELAGEFENARKTELWLQKNSTDVMFLDIEMPKKNGVQFLKELKSKPLVIFTTAYSEYALEGYELDIIDYLLKPISYQRFLTAVQKAKEYLDISRKSGGQATFMFVRSDKKIEKIYFSEILFIESAGNYVIIHTDKRKIMAYLTLKGLEGQLPPGEFLKVHQSFLVNFAMIDSIDGNSVKISDKEVPISRNYRDAVMALIAKHIVKREQ